MQKLASALVVLISAAAVFAQKNGEARFAPGPASSFHSKQTNDNVTVAAEAYDSDELARTAFGKLNPNQYGVLPILVIIQNDTGQALRLDNVMVEFIDASNRQVEATPASELQYIDGPSRPSATAGTGGAPLPIPHKKHKNPLSAWEIEGRAFAPKMLPAHESANGFFYFQARMLPGAHLYLTGIQQAASGKDVFYFEIPLEMHR
jgi:hypothetical protein